MNYPFGAITINGRDVSLTEICSNSEAPLSEFEVETFSFVKAWLSDQKDFTIATSGSTGKPKIISINRDQFIASAKMTIETLGLLKNDTALVCLPTQFIAGRMMLVRAFEAGMKIIAVDPSSNPLKSVSSGITFAAFVPLQLQTILESDSSLVQRVDRMKAIIVGGGMVSASLKNEISKLKTPVYASYGMTETLSHIALQRLNGLEANPSFSILPGVKIDVDERGCLLIETPYLPEKVITNDLVELQSQNTFKWLGRWDNIINTGGIKIIPERLKQKVKNILTSVDINHNFFIAGLPDERYGNKVVLILEGSNIQEKEQLLSLFKQTFSKHEAPKDILVTPEFSYTDTGKINRENTLKTI